MAKGFGSDLWRMEVSKMSKIKLNKEDLIDFVKDAKIQFASAISIGKVLRFFIKCNNIYIVEYNDNVIYEGQNIDIAISTYNNSNNNKLQCTFDMAWIGQCEEDAVEGSNKCAKHKDLKCASCGEPATHECPETSAFVCGEYLCDNCEHTICQNGCNSGAPLPPGLKRHCKKEEQVYKPWFIEPLEC